MWFWNYTIESLKYEVQINNNSTKDFMSKKAASPGSDDLEEVWWILVVKEKVSNKDLSWKNVSTKKLCGGIYIYF